MFIRSDISRYRHNYVVHKVNNLNQGNIVKKLLLITMTALLALPTFASLSCNPGTDLILGFKRDFSQQDREVVLELVQEEGIEVIKESRSRATQKIFFILISGEALFCNDDFLRSLSNLDKNIILECDSPLTLL